MANIPGVVTLFRPACRYVGVIHLKSSDCSPLCVQNVTFKGWKAMKGESVAIRRSIDYSRNAAQLYASRKGWHIGGRRRETISDPDIISAMGVYATEKGRFMRHLMQARMESIWQLTVFHSWKGTAVNRMLGVRTGSERIEGKCCEDLSPIR